MFDENVARADRYPVELTHRVTLVPASAHHTGPGPDPAYSTDGALVVAKHQRALNDVRERQVLTLAKHCLKEREYTLRRGRVRSDRKHDLGHLAPCWNLSPRSFGRECLQMSLIDISQMSLMASKCLDMT